MAKDPAILLYTSDFLTGCMDLTMEERGQYITLLCAQHQKGHLEEKTIRLLVGSASVSVLSKFKQDENGLFFNERMDIEIENRARFVGSRRENGSKGGRPKKTNENLMDNHMHNHKGNLHEDENVNDNGIETKEGGVGETIDQQLSKDIPPPKSTMEILESNIATLTEQGREIINSIMQFWGLTEMRDSFAFRQIAAFARTICHRNRAEAFIQNFKAYKELITTTDRKRFGWQKFIGTADEHFENGPWALNNYESELIASRKGGSKNKPSRGLTAHHEGGTKTIKVWRDGKQVEVQA